MINYHIVYTDNDTLLGYVFIKVLYIIFPTCNYLLKIECSRVVGFKFTLELTIYSIMILFQYRLTVERLMLSISEASRCLYPCDFNFLIKLLCLLPLGLPSKLPFRIAM